MDNPEKLATRVKETKANKIKTQYIICVGHNYIKPKTKLISV